MRGGSDTLEIIIVPKAEHGRRPSLSWFGQADWGFPAAGGGVRWRMGGSVRLGPGLLCAERSRRMGRMACGIARRTPETRRPKPSLPAAPRPRNRTESCIKGARSSTTYAAGVMDGSLRLSGDRRSVSRQGYGLYHRGSLKSSVGDSMAYWKYAKLTSASQEGFNNKIGWLTRLAYGYHNEKYLHLKIYDLPNLSTRKSL